MYRETFGALGFTSIWRDANTNGTDTESDAAFLCEAHHAPALLSPAALASEHARFVLHLVEALGTVAHLGEGHALPLPAHESAMNSDSACPRHWAALLRADSDAGGALLLPPLLGLVGG